MLYDQAQLVNVYLDAFVVTKDLQYSQVARDVLDYLHRDMTNPEGGIFSAEDADSAESSNSPQMKEGLFYIWSAQEVFSQPLILSSQVRSQETCSIFHYLLLFNLFCMWG
jgi:uncharacterized protein YyaL (SSP411 family)